MFVVTNLVSAFSQQNSADLVKMLLLLITVPVQGEKACLARAYDARRRRVLVGKEGEGRARTRMGRLLGHDAFGIT